MWKLMVVILQPLFGGDIRETYVEIASYSSLSNCTEAIGKMAGGGQDSGYALSYCAYVPR